MSATYTVEEVKKHNKSGDCWIIFKGKVYDVTPFLEDHPGGQEIVLEHAGTDATVAFEDVGHSESAYEMLKDFCIGQVGEKCSEATESKAAVSNKGKPASCCAKPSSTPNCYFSIFAGVTIIGAAVAYQVFFRS